MGGAGRGWETTGFPTPGSFNTESALPPKEFLRIVFNETSFLSRSRKALGTLALLGVTGRLPFSALRGDRTRLDLSTRDGAPALSLSRHRL